MIARQTIVKRRLLESVSASVMAAIATGAVAGEADSAAESGLALIEEAQAQTVLQGQQTEQQDQGLELEEIVVTGSRIARAGFDTLQPAVNLDAEFIDNRGFANVAEALNELSAFGVGTDNVGNQSAQNLGQNFVNTFGLGTQRTLTVINGRRVVGQNSPGLGGAGGSEGGGEGLQVDLNIIPTAMIERVETVFIGGAPIYGTDAIAGTVNIILKDDFEGLSVNGQFGVDQRGDRQRGRVRGLWGANIADGRGNVTLAAEYAEDRGLSTQENKYGRQNFAFRENPEAGLDADGFPITDPNDGITDLVIMRDGMAIWQVPDSGMVLADGAFIANANGDNLGGGPGALKDADGNPLMFDANGRLITWQEGNLGTPSTLFQSVGSDAFNNPLVSALGETSTLISPLKRWNTMGTAHFEISEDTRWILESMWSRTESVDTHNQPPWSTNVFAPGAGGAIRVNIRDNPFISRQLEEALIFNGFFDPDNEEDQFFQVTRSNRDIVEGEPNFAEQNVFRFVSGFEGEMEFLDQPWTWDAVFNFGETNSTTRQTSLNERRFALALDAVTDPETGDVVCRSQIDPPESVFENVFQVPRREEIEECIPFNPFGLQDITEEQRDFLVQQDIQQTKIRQLTVESNISGNVIDLPSGALTVAGGIIHRREKGRFAGDRATRTGFNGDDMPIPNVQGSFDTTEVYGEMLLPIVEGGVGLFDAAFLDSFQIESALRFVDNSNSGNEVTWTAGGRLRPNLPLIGNGLTVRGNFTQSIRAPSVGELFLPQAIVGTQAEDPCDPEFLADGPNPALRRANCEAQVEMLKQAGVLPQDFNLVGFESLIDDRGDDSITGGNPDLDNEKADSWTVGAVFAPTFLPGFQLTVDWTSISIDDEITTLTATQLLQACFDSPNFPNVDECDKFMRDEGFQVILPETTFINAAKRDFRGLVSNVSYEFQADDIISGVPGTFRLFGNFLHNARVERQVSGGNLEVLTGEAGFERLKFQLNLSYQRGAFDFLWQTRHIGSFLVDAQANPERFGADFKGPAERIHNMTLGYQLTDRVHLQVVTNNVFDNVDSVVRRARRLSGTGGLPFQPIDVLGRRFIFSVNANF